MAIAYLESFSDGEQYYTLIIAKLQNIIIAPRMELDKIGQFRRVRAILYTLIALLVHLGNCRFASLRHVLTIKYLEILFGLGVLCVPPICT